METGWAITGNYGLYYGWFPTRSAAIAEHIHFVEGTKSMFAHLGKLDAEQKAAWKKCRKRGDRATKVEVKPL